MEERATTGVRSVLDTRARLGEGPVWDERAGRLRWVDIYNRRVHEFDPATGAASYLDVGDVVGALALTASHALLLARRHELSRLDPATGRVETVRRIEGLRADERLNDGRCDPQGRFWVGSMAEEEGRACLYRFDPDGSLHVMERGLTISNGLGWSPDGRTFYLTDSPRGRIYAYDFDAAAGTIDGRRVFAELGAGDAVPDGLAVDAEGCVWSALWAGGCVVRLAPDGRKIARLRLPLPLTTSCAFGGRGLRDLYVTTASVGMGQQEVDRHVEAGDLFCVRSDATGLPASRFAGTL